MSHPTCFFIEQWKARLSRFAQSYDEAGYPASRNPMMKHGHGITSGHARDHLAHANAQTPISCSHFSANFRHLGTSLKWSN